jgi:hypothetical protein
MTQDDVPHIAACCADCGFIFDLKYGTDCPACHHTGVKWAQLVSDEEVQQRGMYAQQRLRHRLNEWMLTEGEKTDINELERMFALEDNRDVQ